MPHNMVLSAVATLRQLRRLLAVPKINPRPQNSTEKSNPTEAPTTPTATELPTTNSATYMAALRPTHSVRLIGFQYSPSSLTNKLAPEAYWDQIFAADSQLTRHQHLKSQATSIADWTNFELACGSRIRLRRCHWTGQHFSFLPGTSPANLRSPPQPSLSCRLEPRIDSKHLLFLPNPRPFLLKRLLHRSGYYRCTVPPCPAHLYHAQPGQPQEPTSAQSFLPTRAPHRQQRLAANGQP